MRLELLAVSDSAFKQKPGIAEVVSILRPTPETVPERVGSRIGFGVLMYDR